MYYMNIVIIYLYIVYNMNISFMMCVYVCIYIYIYIYIYMCVCVCHKIDIHTINIYNIYQRLKKFFLVPPCLTLSILRYVSNVSVAMQGKVSCPLLHLGVVAIEKEAFRLPSTLFTNFLYLHNIYHM